MRKIGAIILLALALLPGLPGRALAQSACQYIQIGAVLTAAQWNSCFAAKADFSTSGNLFSGGTMTGKLTMIASTTSGAGINLPQGVAPSSPLNGDVWTTSAGLFAQINGTTQGPYLSGGTTVSSVTGTSGQITASPTTGAVVLTLPATITANLTFSGTVNLTGTAELNGTAFGTFATANAATPPSIGNVTPAAGAFTTLSASSTVSGAGFSTYLASPPAIGSTAASTGKFTTLQATTSLLLSGGTSGTTTVQASANAGGTLTLPNATDTLIAKATTDTLTNKTFDTGGAGNVFKIAGTQITAIGGNTATLGSANGTLTAGDCVSIDSGHNFVDAGGPCTTGGGGGTVGSGTTGQFAYYSASGTTVVGNANLTISSSTVTVGVAGSNAGALRLAGSSSGNVTIATVATTSGTATLPANTGTIAELNLAQSWTATQTFAASGIQLTGSSTGVTTLASANAGASNFTMTIPAATDTVAELGQANGFTGNNTFAGTSIFSSKVTVSNAALQIGGSISAAAWTTSGIVLADAVGTLSDTSSNGTVATAVSIALGGDTIATPTNSVTYTNYYGAYFTNEIAGTHVTITNNWALGADSAKINGALTATGTTTVSGATLATSGNISAAAWTTSGVKIAETAVTLSDTSSNGTVTNAYTDVHGGDTITTPTNTVTYTNYYSAYFVAPVAGTHVTLTNAWALGADSAKINGAMTVTGTTSLAAATLTGNLTTNVTGGGTQCVQVNNSGVLSGSSLACNQVTSVSNSDGTLTISPTSGVVVASLALGHANTWSGAQSFNDATMVLKGATSGTTTLKANATAGSTTITFPAATDTVAVLGTAQTFTAAQSFNSGDLKLNGSGSGSTTLNAAATASGTLTLPAATSTLAALGVAQTWTASQTFNNSTLRLAGSSSGSTTVQAAATASGTITLPAVTDTVAVLGTADQTLSGGANVTSGNEGTKSSGTFTVDCGAVPLQYFTNGGGFSLAAPSNDGSCDLLATNNASAGTITFTGFTVSGNTGDSLNTTNTDKFVIHVERINGTSTYFIKALQ